MNAAANSNETDDIDELRRRLAAAERELSTKTQIIDKLEDIIAELLYRRWGRSSEKNPGQAELSLFNEAELAAMQAELTGEQESDDESEEVVDETDTGPTDDATAQGDTGKPSGTKPRKRRRRVLPDHLERVRVTHELDGHELHGDCGHELIRIGEEVTEQIGILPARQFVIQHVKVKYACACKACGVKTALMPAQPLPGSQASPSLLAWTMVSKYHDGLPLYRQEQIWARFGITLPRAKLARWLIDSAQLLQPLYNLLQDELFAYDIAMSDDTGIQVLKEDGRSPSSRSALWIRRGGPPEHPVVLIDYDISKGAAVATRLLDQFHGYLVVDAASSFDEIVGQNALTTVLCNDHARRKFVEATRSVAKNRTTEGWVSSKAVAFYKQLYQLEKTIRALPPQQRVEQRQRKAVPIWTTFMEWAKQVQSMGVRHAKSRSALNYLIKHEAGLRRYCEDGRLPISNILSEHVAKTVALARKNFLFSVTPAGADASALIYSVLESAKANGHNVLHYMTAVLAAIPQVTSVDELDALMPWHMSVQEAARRYADQPSPSDCREKIPDTSG